MRILKPVAISGLCVSLFWSLFAAIFVTHHSGKTGYGGFPVADRKELRSFLSTRGFAPEPDSLASDNGGEQEKFCGSFRGSSPFSVTVSIHAADTYGVFVETAYDFHGLTWRVEDSSKKAQEFADTLDRWLTERRTRSLNARL